MSQPEEEVKAQMPDGRIVIQKPVEQSTPSFYISNALFSHTQWDIRVELGELRRLTVADEDPQTIEAQVIRKATIVMTPAYAKSFLEALTEHIEKYEEISKREAQDSVPPE